MNFDQKAVKFLANFYFNDGKHWTHGPLRQESLMPLRPNAVWWGPCPRACGKMWPPAVPEGSGAHQEHWLVCTRTRKQLWLEQRPPILVDPDCPGPGAYPVPDASLRECSPHPDFSISRNRPIRPEAASRGAWQTVWLHCERPFGEKAREGKKPPLAGCQQLCGHAFPAGSSVGRRPAPKAAQSRTPLRLLRARVAGRSAQPLWQEPLPTPGETAYDIVPGCRLQSLRPPSFSMSRPRSFAPWVNSSRGPGPAAYHVEDCYNSRFPTAPGVVIQGVRRPKRNETGPFSTL